MGRQEIGTGLHMVRPTEKMSQFESERLARYQELEERDEPARELTSNQTTRPIPLRFDVSDSSPVRAAPSESLRAAPSESLRPAPAIADLAPAISDAVPVVSDAVPAVSAPAPDPSAPPAIELAREALARVEADLAVAEELTERPTVGLPRAALLPVTRFPREARCHAQTTEIGAVPSLIEHTTARLPRDILNRALTASASTAPARPERSTVNIHRASRRRRGRSITTSLGERPTQDLERLTRKAGPNARRAPKRLPSRNLGSSFAGLPPLTIAPAALDFLQLRSLDALPTIDMPAVFARGSLSAIQLRQEMAAAAPAPAPAAAAPAPAPAAPAPAPAAPVSDEVATTEMTPLEIHAITQQQEPLSATGVALARRPAPFSVQALVQRLRAGVSTCARTCARACASMWQRVARFVRAE